MAISQTQQDILAYLERVMRVASRANLQPFTTVDVAASLHISRNLASQYLNELMRLRKVVKVGLRPVHYFHRHALEVLLQTKLPGVRYQSVDELFALGRDEVLRDFEKAATSITCGGCAQPSSPPARPPIRTVRRRASRSCPTTCPCACWEPP